VSEFKSMSRSELVAERESLANSHPAGHNRARRNSERIEKIDAELADRDNAKPNPDAEVQIVTEEEGAILFFPELVRYSNRLYYTPFVTRDGRAGHKVSENVEGGPGREEYVYLSPSVNDRPGDDHNDIFLYRGPDNDTANDPSLLFIQTGDWGEASNPKRDERESAREFANGEYEALAETFATIEREWDPDADFLSGPPNALMNELVTLAVRATQLSKRVRHAQLGEVEGKVESLRKSIRNLLGMEW
jgi:hypothetical protein